MRSTMKMDHDVWRDLDDYPDHRVERAAKDALQRIGWSRTVASSGIAVRRHAGGIDGECAEIWWVKLAGIPIDVRHCWSERDQDPGAEMVKKFAATFEALRSGGVRVHNGREAASAASREFETVHADHDTVLLVDGDDIINRCYDCDADFREQFSRTS